MSFTESADPPPLFQDADAVYDGAHSRTCVKRLLDSALDIAARPLDLAWIATQFHVFTGL